VRPQPTPSSSLKVADRTVSHITLNQTSHSLAGDRASSARARLLYSLLNPISPLLPTNITIHVSDHDLGSWLLADDQRKVIDSALSRNRYLSEEDLKPFEKRVGRGLEVGGLVSACPEWSQAWIASLKLKEGLDIDLSQKGMC